MKKVVCIIISCIIILYTVSIAAALKLMMDYKKEEFYNTEYFMPAESTIPDWVEDGSMTFDSAVNALADYDTQSLDMKMPSTCYSVFFDSAGNLLSESKCVLKLKITTDEPFSVKRICLDLDKYMSEETKAEYAEKRYGILSVELYRENDTFIPVALNVMGFDKSKSYEKRIVLTDYQPNVHYSSSNSTYGLECITFEVKDRHLRQKKDAVYDFLRDEGESYRQAATTLNGKVFTGGGGSLEDFAFTDYSYSLAPVHFGNYTYFHYSAIAVNYLEAVFAERDFVKLLIIITAVFAVIGTAATVSSIYILTNEYE